MTLRMVTWAPGCVCRRQSPGKGALEPDPAPPHCLLHLERQGVRSELSQAPSLGTAKHLGTFPVWRRSQRRERAGPAHGACLPGNVSQSQADSP